MSYPLPYGNAPRELDPQWPAVNLYGRPMVEPQPNPYFAHWPQNLGSTGGSTGGKVFKVLLVVGVVAGGWWLYNESKSSSRSSSRKRTSSRAAGAYEVMLIPSDDSERMKFAKFQTRSDAQAYKKRMIAGGQYRYGEITGG